MKKLECSHIKYKLFSYFKICYDECAKICKSFRCLNIQKECRIMHIWNDQEFGYYCPRKNMRLGNWNWYQPTRASEKKVFPNQEIFSRVFPLHIGPNKVIYQGVPKKTCFFGFHHRCVYGYGEATALQNHNHINNTW